jgi:CO/xanthine dehydrogenase FAD-binding subunit
MVNHVIAGTLEEALEYLSEGTYRLVSGGTDLMVRHRSWANTPPEFPFNTLYLFKLDVLKGIDATPEAISIGALTPYETLLHSDAVPNLLKDSIRQIGGPALRHVATLAGNIANASPAADAVLVLITLEAKVRLRSVNTTKDVLIGDLISGPSKTNLKAEELITKVLVPSASFTHTFFKKVGGRKADAISKIAFAGGALVKDGIIKDFKLGINAVNATIVKVPKIEQWVIGQTVKQLKENVDQLIEAYDEYINPIDDQRSLKTYRRHVAHNLIRKFVNTL